MRVKQSNVLKDQVLINPFVNKLRVHYFLCKTLSKIQEEYAVQYKNENIFVIFKYFSNCKCHLSR